MRKSISGCNAAGLSRRNVRGHGAVHTMQRGRSYLQLGDTEAEGRVTLGRLRRRCDLARLAERPDLKGWYKIYEGSTAAANTVNLLHAVFHVVVTTTVIRWIWWIWVDLFGLTSINCHARF